MESDRQSEGISSGLSSGWERVSNSISNESMGSSDDAQTPFWRDQENIVISGVSGRFPRSENVAEFAHNLLSGEDLVTEDDKRWPPGLFDLPKRHGKLEDLKKFDAQFFGVTPKQAHVMDPQVRKLLEVSYEAMIDAGINPQEWRGNKVGVFVGCSASETGGALTQDPEQVTGYTLTGCVRSMFSNRLSYTFDLRGPSFSVDTACSSSLLALQLAVDAIRQDQCEAAIVAGAQLTLTPTAALQFLKLGMLSSAGSCRSFDQSGDGYCRSEAVAAIILQRQPAARRIYATVVHAKSNTDGYKEQGITFPLGERQAVLLEEVYREANVDPNSVYYVESHGTGTKVGDPQEAYAISQVFCSNRTTPLLIGSVKSNMGHAEPASGLASITKLLIAMDTGKIPPNLHFKEPNEYIDGLKEGILKVVTEPTEINGGYIGVNSFGFGGSNTHVILKAGERPKALPEIPKPTIPKIFTYSGRTKEAVESIFDNVKNHADDAYLHQLLAFQANLPPKDTPFRGLLMLNRGEGVDPLVDIQKIPITEQRPIWFVYSGMGSQWPGMAQKLMSVEVFNNSLLRCSAALEEYGRDVYGMLQNSDPAQYQNNTLNCMLAITAIQIALTDTLKELGIVPDGIIGHSTGEMGCGYADGALTAEQTMKLAYHRGTSIMNANIGGGGMAAVGLTWEQAKERCPEGVYPACHNGADSVTISGDAKKLAAFLDELRAEDIFAKEVDSSGVPFHSPFVAVCRDDMQKAMAAIVPDPKPRSSKWISTSIPEEQWDDELAQYCSAEYHTNNACSPVLFQEGLLKIPASAITIELAPHALMQSILRRNLQKTCSNVGMMNRQAENELESFLQALGKIYQAGATINVHKLYPQAPLPVPLGTPMIGPMWKWDHTQDWLVIDGKMLSQGGGGAVAATASYTIDPFNKDSKDAYLKDHVIDGRVLYPFTGHMVLAWKTLCKLKGVDFNKTPVVLEEINVYSATILSSTPVRLDVVISPGNGHFEILDGEQLAASGRIYIPDDDKPFYYGDFKDIQTSKIAERVELDTEDAYKEFLLRGYEYGPAFRGIFHTCNSGEKGTLYWTGNWVTFLDSLLQTALLAERNDTLRLPTRVRHLRIDPVKHLASVVEKDGIQVVELRNDIATNGCVAGGVECCDLNAHTVQRRMQTQGQLYLEKLYFVKHYDESALAEFPKDAFRLRQYRDSLKGFILKGLTEWKKNLSFNTLPYAKHFDAIIAKLTKENIKFNEEIFESIKEDSKCTLAQSVAEIFENIKPDSTDFATNVVNKLKSVVNTFDSDRYWAAPLLIDRLLKTAQDVCIENSAGHRNKFACVEPTSSDQLKHCRDGISSHPLLELDWNCVGPNVDDLDENTLTQLGAGRSKLVFETEEFKNNTDMKNLDYILLDRILYRQKNPEKYLANCAEILRDDGFLIINEVTSDYEISFFVHGLLGTDLPEDPARIYGVYYTQQQLTELFTKNFKICMRQSDKDLNTTTYVIRKIPTQERDPAIIDIDDIKEFTWIEPLQKAIEERMNEPDYKTIWLSNTKVRNNGTLGLALCFVEENLKHNRFRTLSDISVKKQNREGPAVISLEKESVQQILKLDMHANNYRDGDWGSVRHIVVKDDDLHAYKEVEHAFINTLVRGDVSSLTWVESPNQYFEASPERPKHLELCSVYFTSVNFRDVMLAYGRLPPDAIPGQFADRECLLGMEFAGRLKTGKRVMGILPAQALATSVICDPEYTWEIPDNWTMEEASTVPVVYATAYYALVMRGQIRRGESILIHGGSGGVGQAAIAIALDHGLTVYTTVGSEEKRQYLLNRFPQLKPHNLANSRSTDFEQHIRHQTRGRGVDLVLNSLAGDKLQASVRCLAQHGRFLEIGKVDLSMNNALGMAVFLKNVTFHGILLDAIMDQSVGKKEDWQQCARLLEKGMADGVVVPLPASVFESDKAEEAFRFMSAGKHIGKVVIKVRDEEADRKTLPTPIKVKAVCRTLCDPNKSYLITGGLGGFGLELTQWLINRGARNVILTSRSGIKTGYQARCVHFWRRMGIKVLISTKNIASKIDAVELVRECQELGPLGGVFHLAMVLCDSLFETQTVQNFKDASEAKYHGTINIDNATREHCDESLRWFVVFSSITAGRGNAGQTNYGWSNSTMERIIEQRREDGYPGIAVQWGAIGDVGVILQHMGDNSTVVGGTLPQRMPSCLSAFDAFLNWNHPIVSSYVKADVGGKKSSTGGNLLQTIAHILGVNDISQINPDANLGDLGLDSLMGVEIKQALERDYDITLSMKDIRTLTLNKLQKMAESGGSGSTALQANNELEMKKESEREAQQNTVEVIEAQMSQLFKLRVDVNDLEPEEVVVKCNDVEDNPDLVTFFVHPIEGIATPLNRVMSKCTFPAYCFQYTKQAATDSIESVAKQYIKAMKEIQPVGPYRLIGYSYGSCIAFEMATTLQETDGPDCVSKLILLDGSHLYMQTYRNVYRNAFNVTGDSLVNNPLFESEIMCAMTLRFANVDYKKFRVEMLQLPNYKARIERVVETVMKTGFFKSADTVKFACEAMRNKFLMADKYRPDKKFHGKITLIRAEQGAAREEDVGRDYGVGEVSDECDVRSVNGDHDTMVQGKRHKETVEIINSTILS